MQTRMIRFIVTLTLALGLGGLAAGCRSGRSAREARETTVTAAQLTGPARVTLERVTAGGQVEKITKEVEKGKPLYDVEAVVGGKHVEFLISETDGAVLGTEVPVEFTELPEPVRAAAAKFFGGAAGLKAMKGVEFGETSYEVEGTKNEKTVEVTYDPSGKPLE